MDVLAGRMLFRNRIGAVFEVQKSRAFNSHVTSPLLACDRLAQHPSRQQQARSQDARTCSTG
jgi:hypothetical protein